MRNLWPWNRSDVSTAAAPAAPVQETAVSSVAVHEPPARPRVVQEAPAPPAFGGLSLSVPLLRALDEMGYRTPTPIQAQVVPILIDGHDVVGQAQTGTGKTSAFGIPMVERLDPTVKQTQGIVLVPTRELAQQVTAELSRLAQFKRLRVVAVYGGEPIARQFTALDRGAHIVVGTPGRVLDHLGRGTLDLSAVRVAILDEADEMLDIGFAQDMEDILRLTPRERQTGLFSATVPPFIRHLINRYLRKPVWVQVNPEAATVPEVRQVYFEVAERDKLDALSGLLKEREDLTRLLVFRRTQRGVDQLTAMLQRRGIPAQGIHGGLTQGERNRVMGAFRAGTLRLLVATNVAARGLDINDISHVVNYDAPESVEEYIHRIGRTARAGKTGTAFTFIAEWDFEVLKALQQTVGGVIEEQQLSIYAR